MTDTEIDTAGVASTDVAAPAIPGYFADPNLIAHDGRYFLYPTTDGNPEWSSDGFTVFSSSDLISWTDHGEIFSLPRDTTWATQFAWAPAVIERDGRFYLYFTAGRDEIGVAVADSPLGPFTDALGKPLIPAGRYSGTAIDPSVFVDRDGTAYLLWGNTTAHAAKLSEGMTSFAAEDVVVWQPTGFREAAWIHEREGIYYLSWSENDTREEDYRIRYATSQHPLGPWTDRGILVEKVPARGILGTGHHSILRIPDSDDWVIAYHRFAIPGGSGYHREVVIDRLHHTRDGLLEKVIPARADEAPRFPAPTATHSLDN